MTALHLASVRGHAECVKLLIEKGCNLEIRDWNGMTALEIASKEGHAECVKLLIEERCDV